MSLGVLINVIIKKKRYNVKRKFKKENELFIFLLLLVEVDGYESGL